MDLFRRRLATREEVAQGQEEMRREAERLSAGRSPEESKLEKEVEDPDARLDQLLHDQRDLEEERRLSSRTLKMRSLQEEAQSLEPPAGLKEEEIKDLFGQEGQPMLQR